MRNATHITPVRTSQRPRWDIYEEHLDEAAFRWSQWEQALEAPDYVLEEVAELEELVAAHLDGLVLGGQPVAQCLLEPARAADETERIVAADACMELMWKEPVTALAGEAFSAITGLRIEGQYARSREPEESIPLEQEDLDAAPPRTWHCAARVPTKFRRVRSWSTRSLHGSRYVRPPPPRLAGPSSRDF